VSDMELDVSQDNTVDLKRVLECLLFVASEPLSEAKMAEICSVSEAAIADTVSLLEKEYTGRGFNLARIAGGWQFLSASDLLSYVEKMYRPKMAKISKAGLETLAIIAYKQPITRQEIENIRQVQVDGVLATLLDRNLIKEVGRKDTPGKPRLYGTTEDFLSFFGLNSLAELPNTAEPETKVNE